MSIDTHQLRKLLGKAGTPTLYKRTSRHPELDGRRWGWLSEHPPGSHNTSLKMEWTQGERSDYRADLLVKLVNGLPAILDHIDARAAEIEQLEEALYLALEYWTHRQQRYKNRTPVWVQKARTALSGEPK